LFLAVRRFAARVLESEPAEHAYRFLALEPGVEDVAGRVAARRAHRHAVRRAQSAVAGVASVAVIAVGALVLVDDSTERQVAVRPAPGDFPVVRAAAGVPGLDAGPRATVRPVRTAPDEGYLRGPLLEGKGGLALAAYDRSGSSYTFPPSHIVRVDADGDIIDRVDLQGELLSLADGEGARWALTRDKTVLGPEDPEFRVKRIGPDGSVLSNAVPPGEQPAGPIVAGGGGVWVPTRTAVLRYDVTTGAVAAVIPMTTVTDRRSIVSTGKAAYATDGSGLVRLDPSTDRTFPELDTVAYGVSEVVDAAASEFVTWALLRDDNGSLSSVVRWDLSARDDDATLALPAGFEASAIGALGSVAWVEGTLDGRHTVLVVEPREQGLAVTRTIRLTRTSDTNLLFRSPNEVLLTSNGSLFRVRIPE